MKRTTLFLSFVLTIMTFVSCEKELGVVGAEEGNCLLTVQTRSGEADAIVSYPVTVYAMNSDGVCVRRQQLMSASDQLSMNLQALTYHIYALAGAADGVYAIPTQSDATATSAVTLLEDQQHADLMTANNTVTMTEGESNTLTLSLSRKVMELEDITINNVPTTVDAVSVTFSPIYDNLLLNGTYSESTSEQAVSLTEQSDGKTWKISNSDPIYMLPAAAGQTPTIAVKFNKGGNITSYTYTCPQPLEANKHIQITGTYTGDELTLTGTISGATWGGTTVINFTFNGSGSQTVNSGNDDNGGGDNNGGNNNDDEDDVVSGTAPTVGSVYQECYVLSAADDNTGNYTLVTLMHKTDEVIEGTGTIQAEIEAALSNFDINGITGWRLPTEDELSAVRSNLTIINQTLEGIDGGEQFVNDFYYYQSNNGIKSAYINNSNAFTLNLTPQKDQRLRPFTTLKFHKSN